MLPPPPRLPRQHGARVMLAIPALLGLALTRLDAGAGWWALPGRLLAFLAQDAPVQASHGARHSPPPYAASLAFLRFTGGAAVAALLLGGSVGVWIVGPVLAALARLRRTDI